MPKTGTHTQTGKAKTQGLYDRIADVQNLAMKLNGYRKSVAKYLRSLDLKIDSESLVLDAGCGTGIVSLAFQDAAFDPKRAIALDLSFKSLEVARAAAAGLNDGLVEEPARERRDDESVHRAAAGRLADELGRQAFLR